MSVVPLVFYLCQTLPFCEHSKRQNILISNYILNTILIPTDKRGSHFSPKMLLSMAETITEIYN